MAGIVQAHWIKPNHASQAPSRHIYFDTEAHIVETPGQQTQTWRLGVAAFDHRKSTAGDWKDREWCYATTPEDLWEWITGKTSERSRTVVWAHNLGYDLRVSKALHVLPRMGWDLSRLRLSTRDATARFVQGKRSLVFTDFHSWVPSSLENIATMIGAEKNALPTQQDDNSLWWLRCESDVGILGDAVRALLLWQSHNDVGNWQPTGAGQAWSTWRHKHYTHRVLIHDDAEARAAEREGIHAGRAEAWRHGRYSRTKLTELDWSTAYAQVCRDVSLPTRLRGTYKNPSLERVLRLSDTDRVLTRAVVEQHLPVAPCRVDGRLVWPVGRFVTTLWDQELLATVAAGGVVTPIQCWMYKSEPALKAWADWCLNILGNDNPEDGPLIRTIVKQQSRTIIGRFALRYPEWESYGTALYDDASLDRLISPEYPLGTNLLHIGNKLLVETGLAEGQNAAPQVLGYITAEVRTRLWAWMCQAGLENVYYVDTDGMILSPKGRKRIEANNTARLRSKGTYTALEIKGPRQLIFGDRLRVSGVPSSAVPTHDGKWLFESWDSLRGGLRVGRTEQVRIKDRTAKIDGVDSRRIHLNGGLTAPRTVSITEGTLSNQWSEPVEEAVA